MSSEEKITAQDLIAAMAAADVLETFLKLPSASQDYFRDWIGKAADDEAHWRRIDTLVLAIRSAPLMVPEESYERALEAEAIEN